MKIPKKIKIGGFVYKIKEVSEDQLPNDRLADCGRTDHLIRINQDIDDKAKLLILVHEIFHDVNFEDGESSVECQATTLCQLLLDNPDFTKLFIKK